MAGIVDADLLIILSDIEGLYTANPATHPDATLIEVVSEITDETYAVRVALDLIWVQVAVCQDKGSPCGYKLWCTYGNYIRWRWRILCAAYVRVKMWYPLCAHDAGLSGENITGLPLVND